MQSKRASNIILNYRLSRRTGILFPLNLNRKLSKGCCLSLVVIFLKLSSKAKVHLVYLEPRIKRKASGMLGARCQLKYMPGPPHPSLLHSLGIHSRLWSYFLSKKAGCLGMMGSGIDNNRPSYPPFHHQLKRQVLMKGTGTQGCECSSSNWRHSYTWGAH